MTGVQTCALPIYRPSIPFVSLQAACLSIGRLISAKLGLASTGNLVQHDALIGPQTATIVRKHHLPGCYRQSRANTIKRLRGIRIRLHVVRRGRAAARHCPGRVVRSLPGGPFRPRFGSAAGGVADPGTAGRHRGDPPPRWLGWPVRGRRPGRSSGLMGPVGRPALG